MSRAIAIDFDGTLCENKYPNIGEPNWNVINRAKAEKERGSELILLTMREGELLDKAITACKEWGLTFDAVNDNLESWKQKFGNNPRKIGATEYWDDRAYNANEIKPYDCLEEWIIKKLSDTLNHLTGCSTFGENDGMAGSCIDCSHDNPELWNRCVKFEHSLLSKKKAGGKDSEEESKNQCEPTDSF